MALSESCSCPKTPEAPKSKVTPATAVATMPVFRLVRALNYLFDGFSTLGSDEIGQLLHNVPLRRLLSENEPDHRNDHDQ
jgi:hypothetical protein